MKNSVKSWMKPKIISVKRLEPEENVLSACKYKTFGSGPTLKQSQCDNILANCGQYCSASITS